MKTQPIRLLIVDDHPVVRAGLRSLPQAAPDMTVVGEASNTEQAGAAAAAGQPDVALVDIRLRGESGVDLCRRLKSQNPALRVLFLTSFMEDDLILAGLEAGADGYLLKDGDMDRLAAAIREVAQGGTVLDREVAQRLVRTKTGGAAAPGKGFDSLTEKERRLLAEVARGRTDKQAAAALGLTFKTARNYLDRIFAKLGVHTRTEAALIYERHRGAGEREENHP
jgi:DNA-binding NarL/FixJ family response regulator